MDEKYTPYNHKGTKIDGVEPKHRGTPATKRGLSNQQICIITAIQRFTHTIARTLNYGKPSSIDLLRFGKFNHLNTVNSFHKLIEERLQKYKGVASKYINRYNALFIMQRETQGMDNTEKLQYVLLRLKKIYKITRLKDLKNEWLFA